VTSSFINPQVCATNSLQMQVIRTQRLPHTFACVDTTALNWGNAARVTFTRLRLSRLGFDRRSKTMESHSRCGYRTPRRDQSSSTMCGRSFRGRPVTRAASAIDTSPTCVGARAVFPSFPVSRPFHAGSIPASPVRGLQAKHGSKARAKATLIWSSVRTQLDVKVWSPVSVSVLVQNGTHFMPPVTSHFGRQGARGGISFPPNHNNKTTTKLNNMQIQVTLQSPKLFDIRDIPGFDGPSLYVDGATINFALREDARRLQQLLNAYFAEHTEVIDPERDMAFESDHAAMNGDRNHELTMAFGGPVV